MMIKDKKIALYATGGIALYKVANLVRTLIKKGAQVRVAMTEAAQEFVSPLTFQTLTKHKVYTDLFSGDETSHVDHVALAQWADYSVVAPATANTMAKIAHGIADDFVTTSLLASKGPVFWLPAMNDNMYQQVSSQKVRQALKEAGHYIVEPDTGFLAEGYHAKGRFPDEKTILEEFYAFIREERDDLPLKGKKVLVTSGGTIERIDPVRYISNDSSGKMGNQVAEVAYELGAEVVLVTASNYPVYSKIRRIQVNSAEEMLRGVDDNFQEADVLVMAAAVSDYRVKTTSDQKLKKNQQDDGKDLIIELMENPDILKTMGQKKDQQILVGFAAETQNIETYAKKKLSEKNLDMIVANDVSKEGSGFNVDTNEVLIFKSDGQTIHHPMASKRVIAEKILEEVIELIERD